MINTLVILEKDITISEILSLTFSSNGYDVHSFSDFKSCLLFLETVSEGIILADFFFYNLLYSFENRHPFHIFFGADYLSVSRYHKTYFNGFSGFFVKPYDVFELLDVFNELKGIKLSNVV